MFIGTKFILSPKPKRWDISTETVFLYFCRCCFFSTLPISISLSLLLFVIANCWERSVHVAWAVVCLFGGNRWELWWWLIRLVWQLQATRMELIAWMLAFSVSIVAFLHSIFHIVKGTNERVSALSHKYTKTIASIFSRNIHSQDIELWCDIKMVVCVFFSLFFFPGQFFWQIIWLQSSLSVSSLS